MDWIWLDHPGSLLPDPGHRALFSSRMLWRRSKSTTLSTQRRGELPAVVVLGSWVNWFYVILRIGIRRPWWTCAEWGLYNLAFSWLEGMGTLLKLILEECPNKMEDCFKIIYNWSCNLWEEVLRRKWKLRAGGLYAPATEKRAWSFCRRSVNWSPHWTSLN